MAEPDKRQLGDGSDNYTNAASNLAKAARQSGQEAAKQASVIGAEAASRGAGAAVSGGVKAGKAVAGNPDQDGLFASTVYDKNSNEVIVKVVNTGDKAQEVTLNLKGMKGDHSAKRISFHSDNLTAENTLDEPTKIVPQESTLTVSAPSFTASVPARTFYIYKIVK